MSTYDWLASNSAPAGCPMEITAGAFLSPGGGSLYIPPQELHAGWGEQVSAHVAGADTKPLPDRVEITFYSYLEDKIYHGEFPLPYARIEKLFAEGYDSYDTGPLQHATYRWIVAGVAPGGVVAVWLSGIERQVEVFFGKADEVSFDWHKTLGVPTRIDRRERQEMVLTEAEKVDSRVTKSMMRIPFGVWATYRIRYPWQPVFEGMATPVRIERISYLNGERDYLPLPMSDADKQATRPVPSFLSFVIRRTENGLRYKIFFDEEETLSTFQRLSLGGKPLELVFHTEMLEGQPKFSVLLRNDDEAVKLSKIKRHYFRVD
jgi:hypothetical protein